MPAISNPPTPYSAVSDALRAADNARPTESDYAQIGRIALNHSGLEFQLESLTWIYMGSVDIGHVATAQLTTLQIAKALETLVEWSEPDDVIAGEIEWALKAFDILRINRNTIVHGFNFKADNSTGKLFIERKTRSIVFDSFEQFEFTSASFWQMIRDQDRLADHLYHIQRHVDARGLNSITSNPNAPSNPTTLRPRPPLPIALKPLDRDAPQSSRRQRQSSLESEAREAKRLAKVRQRTDSRKR